eukprot:m.24827 g.24827  ORF g.24827 m.24827 type:complete len:322 (-) comp13112_c0_seq4:312-1277(-)
MQRYCTLFCCDERIILTRTGTREEMEANSTLYIVIGRFGGVNNRFLPTIPFFPSPLCVTTPLLQRLDRYDRKAQLRPVFNITIGEYAVGALTVTPNGNEVIVGDVSGGVTSYDLRTGKAVAKFKGLVGACRDIQCHPTLNYVAACGLDRHVRIFNINTRSCVRKFYLKTRMSCLLFSPDERVAMEVPNKKSASKDLSNLDQGQADDDVDEDDVDDDALWAELDTASAKKREEAARIVESKVRQSKRAGQRGGGSARDKKRKQSVEGNNNAAPTAPTTTDRLQEKRQKKQGKKAPAESSMMPMLASVTGLDDTRQAKTPKKK